MWLTSETILEIGLVWGWHAGEARRVSGYGYEGLVRLSPKRDGMKPPGSLRG
nr:hypothetical protein [Acetobacter persici]